MRYINTETKHNFNALATRLGLDEKEKGGFAQVYANAESDEIKWLEGLGNLQRYSTVSARSAKEKWKIDFYEESTQVLKTITQKWIAAEGKLENWEWNRFLEYEPTFETARYMGDESVKRICKTRNYKVTDGRNLLYVQFFTDPREINTDLSLRANEIGRLNPELKHPGTALLVSYAPLPTQYIIHADYYLKKAVDDFKSLSDPSKNLTNIVDSSSRRSVQVNIWWNKEFPKDSNDSLESKKQRFSSFPIATAFITAVHLEREKLGLPKASFPEYPEFYAVEITPEISHAEQSPARQGKNDRPAFLGLDKRKIPSASTGFQHEEKTEALGF